MTDTIAVHDSIEIANLIIGRISKGEAINRIVADIIKLRPTIQFFVIQAVAKKYPESAATIGKIINNPTKVMDLEEDMAYIIGELKNRKLKSYAMIIEEILEV